MNTLAASYPIVENIDASLDVLTAGVTVYVALDSVQPDSQLCPREQFDEDIIDEYAATLTENQCAEFDPIDVFLIREDKQNRLLLAHGYYRHRAYSQANRTFIPALVHHGSWHDALVFSAGVNSNVQRSPGEKKRAILKMLNAPSCQGWNNCQIARACKCNESYVRKVIAGLSSHQGEDSPAVESPAQGRVLAERNGTQYWMNKPIRKADCPSVPGHTSNANSHHVEPYHVDSHQSDSHEVERLARLMEDAASKFARQISSQNKVADCPTIRDVLPSDWSHATDSPLTQAALTLTSCFDQTDVGHLLQNLMTLRNNERKRLREQAKNPTDEEFSPEDEQKHDALLDRLEEKWGTAKGQLWQIGPHRLIIGDSTQSETFERLCGEERAGLTFSDPPYNIACRGRGKDGMTIANDNQDKGKFRLFLIEAFRNISAYMDAGMPIYAWFDSDYQGALKDAFDTADFYWKEELVWVKNTISCGHGHYRKAHEMCAYGWRKGAKTPWFGEKDQQTTWLFDRVPNNELSPCQKPVGLAERAILNSTASGTSPLVLDPFLGSGSTMEAAHNLGRRCYGCELDPKYAAGVLERMERIGVRGQKLDATSK